MNKLTTLFFQLTILFFIGCRQNTNTHTQLVAIDSLLIHEKADSALIILNNLHPNKSDEEDLAYFHLLKTQALYKAYLPIHSDSIINSSISYYEESNNTQKLGWAYFYKACIISEMGKEKEALDILKKAEDIANNSNDKILLHNTCFYIGSINTLYHENLLAIKYLKKASITSKQTRKFNHLMFDYEKLAKVYAEMGEEDSVRYYLNKALAVVDSLPKSQKNDLNRLWLLFGNFYLDKDLHLSKQFYERSLAVKPHGSAYAGLALIKLRQKDTISAKYLFEKGAAINGEIEPKIYILNRLSRIEQETGNYKRANELMQEAQALKDSLTKKQQEDNIRAQQIEYDWMAKQEQTDTRLLYALLTIVGVVVASGILTWYLMDRKRRTERKMKKEKAEITEMKETILSKTEELKSANKELRSTCKKVLKLEASQKEMAKEMRAKEKRLAKGHHLYMELISGGNIMLWKRQDIMDMIDYYRQMNPDFANKTDNHYKELTPNSHLLLILEHIGKSEEDIMKIMNLSEGAFRTLKSRTKQQRNFLLK